jgi:hypothetical protein
MRAAHGKPSVGKSLLNRRKANTDIAVRSELPEPLQGKYIPLQLRYDIFFAHLGILTAKITNIFSKSTLNNLRIDYQ